MPTMRDVAREAGVSVAAVSKVLSGKASSIRVSEATAQSVREIALRLGYRPNILARSLRTGQTRNIGLIFPNFSRMATGSRYMALMTDGVFMAAFEADYTVSVCPKLSNDTPSSLADGRFDGVLWCKVLSVKESLDVLNASPIPIVALHTPAPEMRGRTSFVCCDNPTGLRLAVEHLHTLGHRHIAFAYEADDEAVIETQERIQSFHEAKLALGLDTKDDLLGWAYHCGNAHEWWASHPRFTAIAFRSEQQAGTFIDQSSSMGIAIPEQLSVVGFDSTEYAESTNPKMTCVSQPIEEMAYRATKILIEKIEGKNKESQYEVFPCGFDIRESTAQPPAKRPWE